MGRNDVLGRGEFERGGGGGGGGELGSGREDGGFNREGRGDLGRCLREVSSSTVRRVLRMMPSQTNGMVGLGKSM